MLALSQHRNAVASPRTPQYMSGQLVCHKGIVLSSRPVLTLLPGLLAMSQYEGTLHWVDPVLAQELRDIAEEHIRDDKPIDCDCLYEHHV